VRWGKNLRDKKNFVYAGTSPGETKADLNCKL